VQPQEKQLVREKEMQLIKLQQEKGQQQDENVVQVERNEKHQHEDEKLQQEDDQQKEDDDNLVFTFFYLNYRMLILPRNFRA